MRAYQEAFAAHGLVAAQLLLTHDDIDSRQRRQNAENTLAELLTYPRVVPIINENDSVAVEELKFGDNDTLSAEVAQLCSADLLLILTGSDGLHGDGKRLPIVADPVEARRHVTGEKGAHSTGGMGSKLDAVVVAIGAGIETWILDGRRPGQMACAVAGGDVGTRFPARQ
jgi:glutamate 5-kinase